MTFGKAAGQASWQGRVRSTQGGNELASIVNAFSTVNTALSGRLEGILLYLKAEPAQRRIESAVRRGMSIAESISQSA